ncbi:MAG: tRNA lysidine(34) synthetase TilS [Gemmatimonadota bacterium]
MAVSGGLDSMALLALLARDGVAGEGLEVVAAHFDHGTRGAESAADGKLVAAAARAWGVRCVRGRGKAPARAHRGHGPMAAARELRYAFMRRTVARLRASALLTAHQRDDLVETVLLRLARGTSPDGLAGPSPLAERDGLVLLRPLLPFSRAALAGWAAATGVPFREDPSNRSPRYPRTRIRHDILPRLAELNPRVDEAIVRLASLAATDGAYLRHTTRAALEEATVSLSPMEWTLRATRLTGLPDAILSRVVLAGWAWAAPVGAPTPGAEWVASALAFVRGGRGGRVACPGGGGLRRSGPQVRFQRSAAP